jgi:hypothetical protein
MASAKQTEYLLTESDIRQQLGKLVPDRFIKDYAAMKGNTSGLAGDVERIDAEIVDIEGRLVIVEGQIVAIDVRLTTAEGQIIDLRTDLDDHVADTSAHGATGNIVGTDDYASPTVGGTVLLAAAVSDATPSFAVIPTAPGSAPLVYDPAYADAQTAAISALIAYASNIQITMNTAIAQLNALLASERAAKQLAP